MLCVIRDAASALGWLAGVLRNLHVSWCEMPTWEAACKQKGTK